MGFRNGHSIQLWLDNWIDHEPIAQRFPLLLFPESDRVVDIIQGNSWIIPENIPAEVHSFLLQQTLIPPPPGSLGPDKLSWKGNASGILSLKSAWNTLRSREAKVDWHGLVWNNLIHPRLSCF